MVTPTCPYCTKAVILAQQMAYYSNKVKADMVEVTEFPHLAQKYSVQGVPRTIINEDSFMEGAAPEAMLLAKIKEIL
jgi:glutaredoxin